MFNSILVPIDLADTDLAKKKEITSQDIENDEISTTRQAVVESLKAGVNLALGTWHWGPYPILDYVCPKCDLGGDQGVPDWYVSPTGKDEPADK